MSGANIEWKKPYPKTKYHLFSILKSRYTKNNIYCEDINKIALSDRLNAFRGRMFPWAAGIPSPGGRPCFAHSMTIKRPALSYKRHEAGASFKPRPDMYKSRRDLYKPRLERYTPKFEIDFISSRIRFAMPLPANSLRHRPIL